MRILIYGVIYLTVVALFIIGWVMNIVALVSNWGVETSTFAIARIVGIVVAPIGGVLGWLL